MKREQLSKNYGHMIKIASTDGKCQDMCEIEALIDRWWEFYTCTTRLRKSAIAILEREWRLFDYHWPSEEAPKSSSDGDWVRTVRRHRELADDHSRIEQLSLSLKFYKCTYSLLKYFPCRVESTSSNAGING